MLQRPGQLGLSSESLFGGGVSPVLGPQQFHGNRPFTTFVVGSPNIPDSPTTDPREEAIPVARRRELLFRGRRQKRPPIITLVDAAVDAFGAAANRVPQPFIFLSRRSLPSFPAEFNIEGDQFEQQQRSLVTMGAREKMVDPLLLIGRRSLELCADRLDPTKRGDRQFFRGRA